MYSRIFIFDEQFNIFSETEHTFSVCPVYILNITGQRLHRIRALVNHDVIFPT